MHDDLKNNIVSSGELSVKRQRQRDLQRLEKLLDCWYPIATSKYLEVLIRDERENSEAAAEAFEMASKAVPLVLRIMERKAELLGLNRVEAGAPAEMKSLEELAEIVKAKNPYLFLSNYDHIETGRYSNI